LVGTDLQIETGVCWFEESVSAYGDFRFNSLQKFVMAMAT